MEQKIKITIQIDDESVELTGEEMIHLFKAINAIEKKLEEPKKPQVSLKVKLKDEHVQLLDALKANSDAIEKLLKDNNELLKRALKGFVELGT